METCGRMSLVRFPSIVVAIWGMTVPGSLGDGRLGSGGDNDGGPSRQWCNYKGLGLFSQSNPIKEREKESSSSSPAAGCSDGDGRGSSGGPKGKGIRVRVRDSP